MMRTNAMGPNRSYNRIGAPLLLLGMLASCNAQQPQEWNRYEQYLSEASNRGQFNGVALVYDKGKVVYEGAFGLRSIEPLDSLTVNSQFRLASVSKQFTAMAIMILNEQGKLRYDQDIREFIPEMPYEGITIRHLLHHTSGLPDYVRMMDETWKTNLKYDDPARYISGNEDVVQLLAEKKAPLAFKPGDRWEYSNTGYDLLGTIVARASGMSFAEFAQQHIFQPAGMAHSVMYDFIPGPDPAMPDRAYGFQLGWDRRTMTAADDHYLNKAMGEDGVYSTVGDLLKWHRVLYTEKLVSKATLAEAFTPVVLADGSTKDYGFGWFIEDGGNVVKHSGGWLAFTTYIQRDIKDDKCLIVLTNNSSTQFWGIVQGLTDLLYGRAAELPPLSIRSEMGRELSEHGPEHAIEFYRDMKAKKAADYTLDEIELNMLGYDLLWAGRTADAVAIQQLNLEQFPNSANAYDSYGDALLADGDTANALVNFKKCLAMDPAFAGLKDKIEGIEKGR